jgi:uncharacterized membrane protein YkoI
MGRKAKLAAGVAAAAVIVVGGAGVVRAATGDDVPLEGQDFDRATASALRHVGGGTVVETEVGDEGAAYEVEVRLDDGSQVAVELDESFAVIGSDADDDGPNDVDRGGTEG